MGIWCSCAIAVSCCFSSQLKHFLVRAQKGRSFCVPEQDQEDKMFGILRQTGRKLPMVFVTNSQRTMMKGPGGRYENNKWQIQGLTVKSLKTHYSLIPLFVIMGAGMAFVGAFIIRLAVYSPDSNWRKAGFDEVTNYYENKRFVFFNPRGVDVEANKIPKYKE